MELSHIILAVPKSFFYGMKSDQAKSINLLLSNHFRVVISFGTIHLRRRQIFTIFDPYPPTIGIPAKCL